MSGSHIAVCDEHYQLCSLCNSVTNAAAHTGGTPGCLNVGTCTTCGVEYLPTDPDTHVSSKTNVGYLRLLRKRILPKPLIPQQRAAAPRSGPLIVDRTVNYRLAPCLPPGGRWPALSAAKE